MSYEARDFIGYGQNTPKFHWPNNTKLAINVVVNYEEGGELTPLYGDQYREEYGEVENPKVPMGQRDFANESMFEYGSRVGVWRIINLLEDLGIKATVFGVATALQRHPEIAKKFTELGYDIAGHGYRWTDHFGKSKDEERREIKDTIDIIENLTSQKPKGWFVRHVDTENTREILLENDIKYSSNAYNDDIPYYVTVSGKPLLIIPYSLDTNDMRFQRESFHTAGAYETYLKDTFDTLYKESQYSSKMMTIGLHTRIIGKPGRIKGLKSFLEYAGNHQGVSFLRRGDIADFWLNEMKYKG